MGDENDTKKLILESIKRADPPYVTILDIAQDTQFTRETVSKYMHILHAEEKIKITKKVGKINLYEATE